MSRMNDLDLRRRQGDALDETDRELIAAAEAFELVNDAEPPRDQPAPLSNTPDFRRHAQAWKPVPGPIEDDL